MSFDTAVDEKVLTKLRKVASRFFAATPEAAISKALQGGASSLASLCFHWAADAVRVNRLERLVRRRDRSLPPSLAYITTVKLLATIINQEVRATLGPPAETRLPETPAGLKCVWILLDPGSPRFDCPKKRPGSARYVGGVEWASSPMHSRQDSYYLSTNRKRTYWILWLGYYDDNETFRWIYMPSAYCSHRGVSAKDAAVFLLRTAWTEEAAGREELDRFHFIHSTGILTADEIMVLADEVWGKTTEAPNE